MAWRTQAWYTQERGGFSRGDVITGRIVRIKRTEWLWAELNTVVSVHFSSFFTYMENECIQGSTDELHIFRLCYIYLQKSKGSCKIQTSIEKSWMIYTGRTNTLRLWQRGCLGWCNAAHFNGKRYLRHQWRHPFTVQDGKRYFCWSEWLYLIVLNTICRNCRLKMVTMACSYF